MHAAKRRLAASAVTFVVGAMLASPLTGYHFDNKATWNGPVTMQLQLGPSGTLADGSADWDQSAADALDIWNTYLNAPVQFKFLRASSVPIKKNDKNNNVFFADDVFGEPFPTGTAAVTLLRWSGSRMSDADVVFNRGYSYNSYRGPNQGAVLDFRRVALHEFGHVLGLNHPDVAGQSVNAIMNSVVGDTDELQSDDVQGVESIYGRNDARSAGTKLMAMSAARDTHGLVGFPALGDIESFSAELEATFRTQLQRPAEITFVDSMNAARWTQEYVRYRVQACSHAAAIERTFMQLDGLGIQPVCGAAVAAGLAPRHELFDFRTQLEAKFRDEVKVHTTETHVGAPSDAAWLQEYLRYRLGACSHADASARVLDQLNGRGVAPTCN